ncbi:MAG TPA: glycosyltransferase family 2 protein [Paludibacteraceae bacterium]|nr:glycosyltransferase family 2 protein [Paludibacteraceae bacterium]
MFNASIVLYNTPFEEVELVVATLRQSALVQKILLLDNSPKADARFTKLPITYIFNDKNLGYGASHNIALRQSLQEKMPYHLVLNADIQFDADILAKMKHFMDKNVHIGLLMPKVFYPDGKIQYLCKLLPTPWDLLARRFLPKSWIRRRTERFELRASGYNRLINAPYLSGCFMLLRTEALEKVGLFDERFFMYPEDIDLTRRIHRHYATCFYPDVSVIHAHTQGSYKNRKLLWIHLINMAKYFNKWGWLCDSERRRINAETLKSINIQ